MKIVIEIPEHIYEHAKNCSEDSNDEWDAIRAIANGTPFPEPEMIKYMTTLNEGLQTTITKALERPHGECRTCKHFVRGGLDGKTYVCEHPDILLDDYFDYACITMDENDFCSRYEKERR